MTNKEIATIIDRLWTFASNMVERHAMNGDNTMTDADHALWQSISVGAVLDELRKRPDDLGQPTSSDQ